MKTSVTFCRLKIKKQVFSYSIASKKKTIFYQNNTKNNIFTLIDKKTVLAH